jgi:hypothetical protein
MSIAGKRDERFVTVFVIMGRRCPEASDVAGCI